MKYQVFTRLIGSRQSFLQITYAEIYDAAGRWIASTIPYHAEDSAMAGFSAHQLIDQGYLR